LKPTVQKEQNKNQAYNMPKSCQNGILGQIPHLPQAPKHVLLTKLHVTAPFCVLHFQQNVFGKLQLHG